MLFVLLIRFQRIKQSHTFLLFHFSTRHLFDVTKGMLQKRNIDVTMIPPYTPVTFKKGPARNKSRIEPARYMRSDVYRLQESQ